ncbi:hypothetical protein C8Q80DRAFT_899825 [Daedaleopsis nitida]|nr:hypothetical protein C8Q80DRAFT_899825 [Daedaleopsis nitida]
MFDWIHPSTLSELEPPDRILCRRTAYPAHCATHSGAPFLPQSKLKGRRRGVRYAPCLATMPLPSPECALRGRTIYPRPAISAVVSTSHITCLRYACRHGLWPSPIPWGRALSYRRQPQGVIGFTWAIRASTIDGVGESIRLLRAQPGAQHVDPFVVDYHGVEWIYAPVAASTVQNHAHKSLFPGPTDQEDRRASACGCGFVQRLGLVSLYDPTGYVDMRILRMYQQCNFNGQSYFALCGRPTANHGSKSVGPVSPTHDNAPHPRAVISRLCPSH